jgi:hypothetical protein
MELTRTGRILLKGKSPAVPLPRVLIAEAGRATGKSLALALSRVVAMGNQITAGRVRGLCEDHRGILDVTVDVTGPPGNA